MTYAARTWSTFFASEEVLAWRSHCQTPPPAGAGRRLIRRMAQRSPCCSISKPTVVDDGRTRCCSCGCYWSASHSGDLVAVVRSSAPVGVDVQMPCRRPAALRRWGQVCGVGDAGLAHWVLGEACLKAVGLAWEMPPRGLLTLPSVPGSVGTTLLAHATRGCLLEWCWGDASHDSDGVYWAVARQKDGLDVHGGIA